MRNGVIFGELLDQQSRPVSCVISNQPRRDDNTKKYCVHSATYPHFHKTPRPHTNSSTTLFVRDRRQDGCSPPPSPSGLPSWTCLGTGPRPSWLPRLPSFSQLRLRDRSKGSSWQPPEASPACCSPAFRVGWELVFRWCSSNRLSSKIKCLWKFTRMLKPDPKVHIRAPSPIRERRRTRILPSVFQRKMNDVSRSYSFTRRDFLYERAVW